MSRIIIGGIYRIRSDIKPNRFYIGSTVNFQQRINEHISLLWRGSHHSIKLQRHYNKYGLEDLGFCLIEPMDNPTVDILLEREQFYMDSLHPYFNCIPMAISNLGIKRSDETKKKISEKLSGRKLSEEHVKNIKLGLANRSEEEKAETRKKKRTAQLDVLKKEKDAGIIRRPSMLGRHHSDESKAKISQSNKNKKYPRQSDESQRKRGESVKKAWQRKKKAGYIKPPLSESHKKNISIGIARYNKNRKDAEQTTDNPQ